MQKQQSVQSIDRALRILNVLTASESSLPLSEIAKQVEIPVSTAHRILAALQKHEYVRFDPTQRKYTLGLAVLPLAEAAKAQIDITKEAVPLLEKLAAQVNETASLVVLHGDEAVYALMARSTRTISIVTPLGRRVPFNCTAAGKVILSYLPKERRDKLLHSSHKAYTRNSITNPYKLLDELAEIKIRGIAFDNEEYELGMRCMHAPVFDHLGQITATVGISGPSSRITPERDKELSIPVRAAATELSFRLGYREATNESGK